jgi:hypothetical protein
MSATVVRKFQHEVDAPFCGEPCCCYAHPRRFERALESTAASSQRWYARPGEVQTRFAAVRTPRLAPPRWLSSRAAVIRRAPRTPGSAPSSTAGRFTDPSDRPCRCAQCHCNPRPAFGKQHVWNGSVACNRDLHAAIPESASARRRSALCTCRSRCAFTESAGSAPPATTCKKHPLPCNDVPDVVSGLRDVSHRPSS